MNGNPHARWRWPAAFAFVVSLPSACLTAPDARLAERVEELSDQTCACATVSCAQQAADQVRALTTGQPAPEPAARERLRAAVARMSTCMTDVALKSARR